MFVVLVFMRVCFACVCLKRGSAAAAERSVLGEQAVLGDASNCSETRQFNNRTESATNDDLLSEVCVCFVYVCVSLCECVCVCVCV